MLEDLRPLISYEMDAAPRLCLLLVSLTELRRHLATAMHESLAQRIVVRYHLGGLARDELGAYLDYRLKLAGTSVPLFEPSAVEALYQATHGLPRKVNGTSPLRAVGRRAGQGAADRPRARPPRRREGAVKCRTVFMPMPLPRISDQAAVQLLDILEQLLECVRHHYAPQIEPWQRRQRDTGLPFDPTPPPDDGLPF